MVDDLLSLLNIFDDALTFDRAHLLRVILFDYYDKKFKERFKLSKSIVKRLLDEVSDNQTLFLRFIVHFIIDLLSE